PSLLSLRTKLIVALKASAWINKVNMTALAPTANGIKTEIRLICVILLPQPSFPSTCHDASDSKDPKQPDFVSQRSPAEVADAFKPQVLCQRVDNYAYPQGLSVRRSDDQCQSRLAI